MMAALAAAALVSCGEKVDKNITWPEWASRPIVEDAALVGADGSRSVTAGDKVIYSAKVHDDYNDLVSYELRISYEGNTASVQKGEISGSSVDLDMEFVLPFAASLSDGLVPEVTLEVVNAANGKVTRRLDAGHNITVCRPEIPEELSIVDEKGGVYKLIRTGEGYAYALEDGADITGLGTQFVIASKVSSGKPDFSGLVWGQGDEGIVTIGSDGSWIKTPDSGGYGFKKLGFDTFSFNFDKLVNYKVVVDKSVMDAQEQSGVNYLVAARQKLVRDCEVEFVGFGDLKAMLQPDRFEILDATSAKFTGHPRNWTFFYDVDDNWMILNYVNFNEAEQVWVTGQKACFPLGNESSDHPFNYLASDGKDRYATLAAVMDEGGVYRCLVYLMEDYVIQLFSWVKWSTVISMTSMTPGYGEITADGCYINPGSEFTPGVYMLVVELTKKADNGGEGAVANVSLIPYTL